MAKNVKQSDTAENLVSAFFHGVKNNCGEIWGNFIKCMVEYVNFKGRADRYEYWSFMLVYSLILAVIGFFCGFYGVNWPANLAQAVFLLPLLAVLNRRLHDHGKNLWRVVFKPFVILSICYLAANVAVDYANARQSLYVNNIMNWAAVALISYIFIGILYFTCRKGSDKDNAYGSPVPYEEGRKLKGKVVMLLYFCFYFILLIAAYFVARI